MTRIYFDESGFTGSNLLSPNQALFSYASVCTEPGEAKDFVRSIRRRYNVQSEELKGSNLLKFAKGRRALSEILEHFGERSKVCLFQKKYALAAKFFEYIFEPTLSRNSMLFYRLNFHRFISNILFVEFVSRGSGAEQIFEDFERLMRTGVLDEVAVLFSSSNTNLSPILNDIRDFALLNRESIRTELEGYAGTGAGKWVLDLTNTALFSLLAEWGKTLSPITAICDSSRPLAENQDIFNVMIGKEEKVYSPLGGTDSPITFNLAGPLQFADSREEPAIQIADCVAAISVAACGSTAKDSDTSRWRERLSDIAISASVFPDTDHVDLSKLPVQRNVLILIELLERSRNNFDLLHGMQQVVAAIEQHLERHPLPIDSL